MTHDADHAAHRHGARRGPRRAHAAADRRGCRSRSSGRRQAADRPCARPAGRCRGRARGGQRALSRRPDRAPSRRPHAAADRDLRRARQACSAPAAVWSRRSPRLGASRSSTSTPTRSGSTASSRICSGWPKRSIPTSMDALLLLAPAATSIGYAGRGDFAMTADGRLRAAAGARGRAVRLCRRGAAAARAVRRRAVGRISR